MILAALALASTAPADPPKPNPSKAFENVPWRNDTVVKPAPSGPAYLVIASGSAIKTVPYKTMRACLAARAAVAGPPAGTRLPNGAILGPPAVTYSCLPR